MLEASCSFENCDDTTLVGFIKSDGSMRDVAFEAMCARYMGLISSIITKYRYSDEVYELSDFIQEGLIGLMFACKSYDAHKGMTFKNYAMMCVENRFRSIYRHSNGKAHIPKSNIVTIDDTLNTLEDSTVMSMQESLEAKEYIKSVYKKIESSLSELEKNVLSLYLSGYSYKQSAKALSISEKAIDNALYRIRKKLSR